MSNSTIEQDGSKRKSIGEASVETRIFVDKLQEVGIGEIVTWATLSDWVQRDCRPGQQAYGYLQSARNFLLSHEHMVFSAVSGEGLKRLADEGKISAAEGTRDAARRKHIKGIKMLAGVELDALPREEKTRCLALQSQLGVLVQAGKPSVEKKLRAAVERRGGLLPTAEAVKQFL